MTDLLPPRTFAERAALSLVQVDPNREPHSFPTDMRPGEWWACSRPESPPDDGVWWDEVCPACHLAYKMHQLHHPHFAVWFKGRLVSVTEVSLDDFAEANSDD